MPSRRTIACEGSEYTLWFAERNLVTRGRCIWPQPVAAQQIEEYAYSMDAPTATKKPKPKANSFRAWLEAKPYWEKCLWQLHFELLQFSPRLQRDFPADAEKTAVRWVGK